MIFKISFGLMSKKIHLDLTNYLSCAIIIRLTFCGFTEGISII